MVTFALRPYQEAGRDHLEVELDTSLIFHHDRRKFSLGSKCASPTETSQRLTGLLITKLKDVAVQEDCVKENVSSGRASTRLGGVMRVERGLT